MQDLPRISAAIADGEIKHTAALIGLRPAAADRRYLPPLGLGLTRGRALASGSRGSR